MKLMRICLVLVICASFGYLTGCSSCGRQTEVVQEETQSGPPRIPVSTVSVPVRISLDTIAAAVEQDVPKTLEEKQVARDPVQIRYSFARGPILLAGQPDGVRITVPVTLTASSTMPKTGGGKVLDLLRRYTGDQMGCKSTVEITFLSKLSLTGEWQLRSQTEPLAHKWVEPCKLSVAQIDVTDLIEKPLTEQLVKVAAVIDQKIQANGDLKPKIAEAWKALGTPTQVSDGTWLVFNPETISLGDLRGEGKYLHTRAGITARPELVEEEVRPAEKPLPANRGSLPPDGFRIALPASIAFTEATRQLNEHIAGKEFDAPGGRKIRVQGGTVSGKGGRLLIELTLSGDVGGKVTLTGIPQFDKATSELVVDQLDYDLETRNLFARAAAWLFDEQIRQAIAKEARFSLEETLTTARAELHSQLNRRIDGQAKLSGSVESLEIEEIYAGRDSFVAVVLAAGKLSLEIG